MNKHQIYATPAEEKLTLVTQTPLPVELLEIHRRVVVVIRFDGVQFAAGVFRSNDRKEQLHIPRFFHLIPRPETRWVFARYLGRTKQHIPQKK